MAQNEPKGQKGGQAGGQGGGQASGQSGRFGSSEAASPAMVTKLLEGINFPADKRRIEQHVQQNQARVENTEEILGLIRQLPDKQYQGVPDITQALGQLKR